MYRSVTFFVSLLTPLLDMVYKKAKFPANGYVVNGPGGDVTHTQAKLLEAAFSTFITAAIAFPYWSVHMAGIVNKAWIKLFKVMTSEIDAESFKSMDEIRFDMVSTSLRVQILYFRDVMVGLLEVARAVATLAQYTTIV